MLLVDCITFAWPLLPFVIYRCVLTALNKVLVVLHFVTEYSWTQQLAGNRCWLPKCILLWINIKSLSLKTRRGSHKPCSTRNAIPSISHCLTNQSQWQMSKVLPTVMFPILLTIYIWFRFDTLFKGSQL